MALAEFLKNVGKGIGGVAGGIASRPTALFTKMGKGLSNIVTGVGRVLSFIAEFPMYIIANHPELIAFILTGAVAAGGLAAFASGSSAVALVIAAYVGYQVYGMKQNLGAESSFNKIWGSFKDSFGGAFEKAREGRLAWR
jgi:hypothetical protein